MKQERWEQIKTVLENAVELDVSERPAYLDGACGSDSDLRREVESLLSSHERAGSRFMGQPAVELLNSAPSNSPAGSRVGTRAGVYELVEEIAHGGMGEVYRARRVDGHYEKEVAVKLVRVGMDTSFVLERFLHERQILASLDHPCIAHLLDGGTTDEGVPYFVMELIVGTPIDEYCDTRHLSITDRLKLFQQVCSAVQYAHQHLVIHRDIKPNNILVTEGGEPKLLDFGIAKMLDPSGEHEATVLRPMTPEYASPEQIRGEPITTATDVYSLGIVLYRLLTGSSPYRGDTRNFHEMSREVVETDPVRPSLVVLQSQTISNENELEAEASGQVFQDRATSPAKLKRCLTGDLDTIVLKALRKEPERRYSSVEQLAEDIRRHLDGLPVAARRGSWSYRASKFTQRHKVGMIATVMIALALLAGMVLTLREARIAEANRQLAEANRKRAEQRFNDVRRLANSLMFEVHDSIKDLPGSTPARKLLVTRALEYLDSLSREAKGDASLQRELAAAYERIGDVQGQPRQANLGDSAGAADSYGKALAIREALLAANPNDPQVLLDLTPNYGKLSDLLWTLGNPKGAMENAHKEISTAEAAYRVNPSDPKTRLLVASYRMDYGYRLAVIGGDRAGGLNILRQGSNMLEQLSAENPNDLQILRTLGLSYSRTAGILEDRPEGREEALALYKKAIAVKNNLLKSDPTNTDFRRLLAYDQYTLGNLLAETDLSNALGYERSALASFDDLSLADPLNSQYQQDRGRALSHIGQTLTRMRDFGQAREPLRQSLTLLEKLPGKDNPHSIVGYAIASDRVWLGKATVGLASATSISTQQKSNYCREAESWFRQCQPAFEELRDHAAPEYEGAERIQEIQQERMICQSKINKSATVASSSKKVQ